MDESVGRLSSGNSQQKLIAYDEKSKIYRHTNDIVTNTINSLSSLNVHTTHLKVLRDETDLIQVDLSAGWMPKNLFMNVQGILKLKLIHISSAKPCVEMFCGMTMMTGRPWLEWIFHPSI